MWVDDVHLLVLVLLGSDLFPFGLSLEIDVRDVGLNWLWVDDQNIALGASIILAV